MWNGSRVKSCVKSLFFMVLAHQFYHKSLEDGAPSVISWLTTPSKYNNHKYHTHYCSNIVINQPTLRRTNKKQWKMAIEIVDFPNKNGGSFHCYVNVHQRVVNYGAPSCKTSTGTLGRGRKVCHATLQCLSLLFCFGLQPVSQGDYQVLPGGEE